MNKKLKGTHTPTHMSGMHFKTNATILSDGKDDIIIRDFFGHP